MIKMKPYYRNRRKGFKPHNDYNRSLGILSRSNSLDSAFQSELDIDTLGNYSYILGVTHYRSFPLLSYCLLPTKESMYRITYIS